MSDSVITNLELKKDTAKAVSENLALNIVAAVNALQKGRGLDKERNDLEENSGLRNQLFLKYCMIDYEGKMQQVNRLSKLK